MCHLNVLIKKSGDKWKKGQLGAIVASSYTSYNANHHAEGIYYSGIAEAGINRSVNKIEMIKLIPKLEKSDIILLHERIATSGKTKENTQPFISINKRWVIAHNGIIDIKAEAINPRYSDTRIFAEAFFKRADTAGVMEALKEAFKEIVEGGSWSIAVWDNLERKLYYLKEDSTTIHISKLKGGSFFITTSWGNTDFFNKKLTYKVEKNRLYAFYPDDKGELVFWDCGEIKPKIKAHVYYQTPLDWRGQYSTKEELEAKKLEDLTAEEKSFINAYPDQYQYTYCY
jgi:hypothetical protein